MFKRTSENMQSRQRRQSLDSRDNSAGIDETVFKDPEEQRAQLIIQKGELQSKSSSLNAQIKLARRRYTFREPGTVPLRTVERWEIERQGICAQITAIDKRLTEMKVDYSAASRRRREADGFAETFKEVAREMLADPVFQRLITATIHRCGEENER
jgi:hypothetical protein